MSNNALDTIFNSDDTNSGGDTEENNIVLNQDEHAGDLNVLRQNSGHPQPYQDLTTSVEANVSNFNEAQFGTRFVANSMTVVIGGPEAKCSDGAQVFLKTSSIKSKNVTINDKDLKKTNEKQKWLYRGVIFVLILMITTVCFWSSNILEHFALKFSVPTQNNKTDINNLLRKNKSITAFNSARLGFETSQKNLYNGSQSGIKKKTFPLDIGPYLSSDSSPNETILVLSTLLRSLDTKKIISTRSHFKAVNSSIINVIFEPGKCANFPRCLNVYNNRDIDYNFILFQGVLCEIRGWIRSSVGNSLRIMLLFRDGSIIKNSLMYMFLLLVNASIACGYIKKEFTLTVNNDKFYKQAEGYKKFMSILEALNERKYYVDDLEIFKSDTIKLSNKISKLCPLFKVCNSTCINQTCLKSVCNTNEKCFVQCI